MSNRDFSEINVINGFRLIGQHISVHWSCLSDTCFVDYFLNSSIVRKFLNVSSSEYEMVEI